ncbi:geranylgeranylglycerol-phosphate geranylgeranyltransferase [Aquimarina sp. D1M17]|uniref:geranylgeranylglycerol-phosphate geranylgeranyltransferase n=1 Tax=Aquimarina acroporae TaxID=2937283 RepID=UPI0020BE6A01|nr:geranylgeranylglycerol-phosphate geranylgeranyltransferase [Aquimarina acroporae]MCK8520679.1 geranylgeranylglycerol-phosphate geranylgeranyltransferase [Aquimarina acroporae]
MILSFLKLIKFDNLIVIALAQLCVKYGLFEPFGIAITLNGLGIALLTLATVSIAAAGNIILEIYDQDTSSTKGRLLYDHISEKSANIWFILFNCIGVLIGFYLANMIGRPGFVALFIITSGMFYIYATYLKEILVVKNLSIALLVSLSILVVGLFDLLPAITEKNKASQTVIFSIIFDYSIFAFTIIILREIIKDCLRIDKDHNLSINTIPITLGKDRTIKLVGALTIIPIALVLYYIYSYLFSNSTAVLLFLTGIVAPLIYFIIKCFTFDTDKDLKILKGILKIVLIISSLSLLVYQYILM